MKEKSQKYMLLNIYVKHIFKKFTIRMKISKVRLPDQKSFKQMKYYMNKSIDQSQKSKVN